MKNFSYRVFSTISSFSQPDNINEECPIDIINNAILLSLESRELKNARFYIDIRPKVKMLKCYQLFDIVTEVKNKDYEILLNSLKIDNERIINNVFYDEFMLEHQEQVTAMQYIVNSILKDSSCFNRYLLSEEDLESILKNNMKENSPLQNLLRSKSPWELK